MTHQPAPPATPPAPAPVSRTRALRWTAIAVGTVVDIAGTRISTTAIAIGLSTLAAMKHPARSGDLSSAQASVESVLAQPGITVLLSGVGLLCSVAGGFLTAYLAKTRRVLNSGVMGGCSTVFGLVMMASRGAPFTVDAVALAATSIPAALLGGLLASLLWRRTATDEAG